MKQSRKKINIVEAVKNAQHYEVDPNVGLTSEQVLKRNEEFLDNYSPKAVTKTYWEIIKTNAFSLFNIVLYIVAALMIVDAIISNRPDKLTSMFFIVILFFNVAIGIFQDIRARNKVKELSLVTEPKCFVIRDGKTLEIRPEKIVLDDIVILKAGGQICADGIVVDGCVHTNESFLTGESDSIKKVVNDKVFSGSFVVSGTCKYKVTKVGKANYVETLQTEASKFSRPNSEILKSFKIIFNVLTIVVIAIGVLEVLAFIISNFLYKANNTFSSIVSSVGGSLVAMIPIGMYLLTSVTLTVGVLNLSRKRMLVHELYCIEMLARVNVLCLDKTGTLTSGEMTFKEAVYFHDSINDFLFDRYMSSLLSATKDENLTAIALKEKYNSDPFYKSSIVVPFNSDKKYSCAYFPKLGTLVMGAYGFIKASNNEKIKETVKKYEDQGLRVLVIGLSKSPIDTNGNISGVEIIGLVVLKEKIRDDAIENIRWFEENGVSIRIISGDSNLSVSQIAKEVGVTGYDKTVSLDGKTLEETYQLASSNTVFGRVNPEQKRELIKSLRDQGNVVAMTGDGVNDILALKQADCSIAMASGSDAAKTISHLVSLDSNFGSLPDVVKEGRRVINNLQRTCSLFLVKTIFAIVVSAGFFIWSLLPNGRSYPYVTNNLYIWEFLTIGIAAFFLALQPNSERLQGSFIVNILKNSIPPGICVVLIVAVSFICNLINPTLFPKLGAISASVIMITAFSFFTLIRISWPLNKFRLILFFSCLGVALTAMTLDALLYVNKIFIFVPEGSTIVESGIFHIAYSSITLTQALMSALVFLIISILYLFVAHMLKHKKKGKIEEKLEKKFGGTTNV